MTPIKVLIATRQPVPAESLVALRAISSRLDIEARNATTSEEVADLLPEIEVLYTDLMVPPDEATPRLKWVQGHYAGIDQWGRQPLDTPVVWTTTSGIHVHTAELVLTLVLAFGRQLLRIRDYQAKADWSEERFTTLMPYELRGSTVGIVGYGAIGRQVGSLCRAFGMRVVATGRNGKLGPEPAWRLPGTAFTVPDKIYDPSDIASLAAESDYIVLAVPATPQTNKLFGAGVIAAMKPNAVLINVARGTVVDEDVLLDALQTGKIRGAGLDVFVEEPLPPESPFWRLPNVIVCPRVGGFSPNYMSRAMAFFAENLRRYVSGEPLLNVVDKEKGY
jgi:phosphoglycerate dehydrogenase-like enzyme